MARRADLYALLAAAALHRHAAAQQHPQQMPQPDMPPSGFGAQPRNAPLSHNPNGIHWANGVFNSPQELVAWMNARGAGTNVGQFLGNHPGLAAQFGQRGASAMAPRGGRYGIPEGPPPGVVPGTGGGYRGIPSSIPPTRVPPMQGGPGGSLLSRLSLSRLSLSRPRPLQQQVQRHIRQQFPRTALPY